MRLSKTERSSKVGLYLPFQLQLVPTGRSTRGRVSGLWSPSGKFRRPDAQELRPYLCCSRAHWVHHALLAYCGVNKLRVFARSLSRALPKQFDLSHSRIPITSSYAYFCPIVVSLKFVEEYRKATADPSTAFGTKDVPNYARDDSAVV